MLLPRWRREVLKLVDVDNGASIQVPAVDEINQDKVQQSMDFEKSFITLSFKFESTPKRDREYRYHYPVPSSMSNGWGGPPSRSQIQTPFRVFGPCCSTVEIRHKS